MHNRQGFSTSGNWYKGNLHSHSTLSDGLLSPAEAVTLYKGKGYHFLCLSEHDMYTDHRAAFNDSQFIMLPGIEYSAILYNDSTRSKYSRLKVHHVHGILGTTQMQQHAPDGLLTHMQHIPPLIYEKTWPGAPVAQKMTDMLRRHGCITTYNHPVWSRVTEAEFCNTSGLFALEIFNFNTMQEVGMGSHTSAWDTMLRSGMHINAFASDDNHNEGLFEDFCGGWVCVRADALTHDAIIEGLVHGNYYSSSGPEIVAWGIRDGLAYVECSAVNQINFVSGNYINDGMAILGTPFEDSLTHAEHRLKGHETYLRVECVDKYGRTAWTNPLFL